VRNVTEDKLRPRVGRFPEIQEDNDEDAGKEKKRDVSG
jgi:hypothetical protein